MQTTLEHRAADRCKAEDGRAEFKAEISNTVSTWT